MEQDEQKVEMEMELKMSRFFFIDGSPPTRLVPETRTLEMNEKAYCMRNVERQTGICAA